MIRSKSGIGTSSTTNWLPDHPTNAPSQIEDNKFNQSLGPQTHEPVQVDMIPVNVGPNAIVDNSNEALITSLTIYSRNTSSSTIDLVKAIDISPTSFIPINAAAPNCHTDVDELKNQTPYCLSSSQSFYSRTASSTTVDLLKAVDISEEVSTAIKTLLEAEPKDFLSNSASVKTTQPKAVLLKLAQPKSASIKSTQLKSLSDKKVVPKNTSAAKVQSKSSSNYTAPAPVAMKSADLNLAERVKENLLKAKHALTLTAGEFHLVLLSMACNSNGDMQQVQNAIRIAICNIERIGDIEFLADLSLSVVTGRVYTHTENLGKRIEGTIKSLLKNQHRFPGTFSEVELVLSVSLDSNLLQKLVSETRQKVVESIDKSSERVAQQLVAKLKILLDDDEFAADKEEETSKAMNVFKRYCLECKVKLNSVSCEDKDAINVISKITSHMAQNERQALRGLPIYPYKEDIVNIVRDNQVCVFVAETGSGKSTQIVQYLYDSDLFSGRIACTQPRRLAARSLADFVADQMGCRKGSLVASMTSGRPVAMETKIVFMTDFQLLQLFIHDPELLEYDCVVVDEAHERNLHTDLIIGLLKRALKRRPQLKVLITSATINPDLFLNFYAEFSTAHAKIPGRVYKVDVHYSDTKIDKGDRYYERAVDKVVELCNRQNALNGNILVFLTTPRDTEIATDSCLKKLTNAPKGMFYTVLPLHGQLQPEDQKKAMDEVKDKNVIKIIFATNCAETSLTIPGVVVVIDSGLSKQNIFDSTRNMDTLVVGEISRNSADQRKGRAGRTQNGCCYRLYTENEYLGMSESTVPEIQRIDLSGVALRILEFGLNPLEFDYLTQPSQDGLENSLNTLEFIGAIQGGRLTDLGRQIAKIPAEPRLAKIILLSCDRGFGLEGIVLSSIISLSGQVFFRGKTDTERHEATKTKEFYASDEGDLFTSMQVFKDWRSQAKEKRAKWSVKNCVNNKSMRAVDEMVADVTRAMKFDLKVQILDQFSDATNVAPIVLECIYKAYSDKLCAYSGNSRIGFVEASTGQRLLIHPSSVFYGEVNFSLAVYSKLLKTEQTYLLYITPVSSDWVTNALSLEPNSIFCSIARIMPVSTEVLKRLLGKGRSTIRKLETKVREEVKPNLFEIYCNFELHSVDIVCEPSLCLPAAKTIIENSINDTVSSLCKDERLSPDQTQLPCNIWRSPGFVISQLHLFGESSSIKLQSRTENRVVTNSMLEAVSARYSDDNIGQIQVDTQRAILNADSPMSAQRLVEKINQSDQDFTAYIKSLSSNSGAGDQLCDLNELKLLLQFPRRYPSGIAVVTFEDLGDARRISERITKMSFTTSWWSRVTLGKNNQEELMIFNVPIWLDEMEIKNKLNECLQVEFNGFSFNPSVQIRREGVDNVVSKEIARERVCSILRSIFGLEFVDREEDYQIAVRDPPNVKYFDWNAIVCFRFDEDYVKFTRQFKSEKEAALWQFRNYNVYYHPGIMRGNIRERIQSQQDSYKMSAFAATSFSIRFPPLIVSIEMYTASQSLVQSFTDDITDESRSNIFPPDIRCLLNKTPVKIEINTDFKERYRGRETKKTRIDIKTEDLTVWSFTYQHLRKCLKPYELDCSKNEFLKCLLLKSAETALKKEFPESAYAIFDSRRETVSIYGSDAVKSQCQIIINRYLTQRESLSLREISLTGPNRVKGLIRHLLKAFGRDMGRLVAAHQPGLASAELELVTKMLVLSGDDAAAVQAAADQVERLAAEALTAAQNAPAANGLVRVPGTVDLECPVCLGALDAVTASDTATLCGHAYCLECIQLQATNAADVPLVCSAQVNSRMGGLYLQVHRILAS